jgi:hypothetical protein
MVETLIGTVTAASAVIAVAISLYVLRLQLREQRDSRQALEREDALRVTCWAEWSPEEVALLSGAVLRAPVVCVSNRTNEPVFGVFFDYRDQLDGHPVRVDVGTVPPGAVSTIPILLPGSQLTADWQPSLLLPTLFFRDSRNRWWHRNTIGRLVPDPGPSSDEFFASGGTLAPVRES